MRQEMIEFWDAAASAGPHATLCTSIQTDNDINTSSLNFYKPDALPDAQPTFQSTEGNNSNNIIMK